MSVTGFLLACNACAALYPNVYGAPKEEVLRKSDWYRQCLRVQAYKPPPKDLVRRGAERCDAAKLYYDTQNKADATDIDWAKVRACALRTNASGVLMMLYANGAGVMPNLNVAMKYACSIKSPVAEIKSRVAHVQRKMNGADSSPIDVCDDVATGEARDHCASNRERHQEKSRNKQLAALVQTWTPKEQLGFEMASKAAHYFAQHRSDFETGQSGGAKRALQLETMRAEQDRFVHDIQDVESGKAPAFSEAEFASIEEKLNQTYQRFMQRQPANASSPGTVRKSSVERTQHAWLAYRDAMELFGSIKYPSVPASGWRALLTARRLTQLTELDNAAAGR